MHGGAHGSGGQPNNGNAVKHGAFAAVAVSAKDRKLWEALGATVSPPEVLGLVMRVGLLRLARILAYEKSGHGGLKLMERVDGPDGTRRVRRVVDVHGIVSALLGRITRAAAAATLSGAIGDQDEMVRQLNAAWREMQNPFDPPQSEGGPALPIGSKKDDDDG